MTTSGDHSLVGLLEALPVGVAALDDARGIARANAAWRRLSGGPTLPETPEVLQALACARRGETRTVAPVWLEGRALQLTLFPVPGKAGSAAAALVDVTERVEAEARLREAQRVGHVGSWEVDHAAGTLTWTDECYRIFGQDPARFTPSPETFDACVHPDDLPGVEAAYRAALASGQPYEVEHRIMRPDGSVRRVLERAEIERDAAGKPLRSRGTVQDITERAALEARLLHAEKLEALSRMSGGLAHDFNNLVAVVISCCEVAARATDLTGVLRAIAEIRATAERGGKLTRQLLAFSRRQPPATTVIDLVAALRETEALLQRLVGEAVAVSVAVDASEPLPVRLESGQLEQLVMNLVVNARDAMPDGGRLRLDLARMDRDGQPCARLVVADEGHGITEDVLPRIFEPFFTTKAPGKGTGLGLATVHGIVRQNGGDVCVESEPGCGTTFTVVLPLVRD